MEIGAPVWEHPVCPRCLLGDATGEQDASRRGTEMPTRPTGEPAIECGDGERAESTHPPRDPLEETNIGGYVVHRVLASGGMGTVYEATQDKPRRTVAVKVMR